MRLSITFLLSAAASTLAYSVTSPNGSQGWTNQGAQPLAWQRVNTDRLNFTAVLTNQNRQLLPTDQVLAALVDGTLGNTTVNPPSGGWPTPGGGYRVNLVQDANDLNTILAQSPEFNITQPTSKSSSTATGQSTATTLVIPATTSADPTAGTVSTPQNAGTPAFEGQLALIPLFSILAFFLA
ncbi:GPI-anchored small secreted protein [Laccaria bicolor S238N-H82]|uniref:GPI-anchored small secreted protein n=1 Tax=Laccaria bicolor (strain S238N-H82 / ATCC MYA-4686) TaxID=486041 RepID=B0CXV6_LACBS|nr:GPI-anchored small secreted protein [Laccaria bicolor S238N-H82]EDR12329.1 GPI-anchored small secreted protein [Laccaria bicolor S238N-H82]|eukprot:XP_001876593.1 GPI-anchored small secreted protein [Laccaria bicolor S238N-H82]